LKEAGGLGNIQKIYSYTAKTSEKIFVAGSHGDKNRASAFNYHNFDSDVEKKSSISYYPPKSYTT